jgi:hypothetical protein
VLGDRKLIPDGFTRSRCGRQAAGAASGLRSHEAVHAPCLAPERYFAGHRKPVAPLALGRAERAHSKYRFETCPWPGRARAKPTFLLTPTALDLSGQWYRRRTSRIPLDSRVLAPKLDDRRSVEPRGHRPSCRAASDFILQTHRIHGRWRPEHCRTSKRYCRGRSVSGAARRCS